MNETQSQGDQLEEEGAKRREQVRNTIAIYDERGAGWVGQSEEKTKHDTGSTQCIKQPEKNQKEGNISSKGGGAKQYFHFECSKFVSLRGNKTGL